ncbi:MAG: rRNA pseudouridine synthase [Candidatus Mcinerneyibacterium aminivorans]|uniref:Pseudouridine synthase n=1 Tax=Candidatus Mcinerneyibacterium aminivorans TaxID=2703815 RepID=A0A5D0MIA9_9BACT|nr:MAG: rRNA pseudouridine synthase [Candidatus Mcinerneyibacterium aminivorans]
MKLIKFVAASTSFSRRDAERLIKNSNIKVNGEVADSFIRQIDPDIDRVEINGEIITKNTKKYFKFYKPEGYVCSKDDKHSKTIYNFIGSEYLKYTYVGRLDKDSSGLLLLTNDGDMIYKLTHPSNEVSREYIIHTEVELSSSEIQKMKNGIKDKKDLLKCDSVETKNHKKYRLKLHTGRKREIKRMIRYFNNDVTKLKRISYGPITLEGLNEGMIKELSESEFRKLKEI